MKQTDIKHLRPNPSSTKQPNNQRKRYCDNFLLYRLCTFVWNSKNRRIQNSSSALFSCHQHLKVIPLLLDNSQNTLGYFVYLVFPEARGFEYLMRTKERKKCIILLSTKESIRFDLSKAAHNSCFATYSLPDYFRCELHFRMF